MKRPISITLLVLLGIFCLCIANTEAGMGVVSVVEEQLPAASLKVTGIGLPPQRDVSQVQKRLLAKRAATVNAYKKMATALNGISGYLVDGSGVISNSGYIKGAQISNIRYFTDGKVEVDLVFPISLSGRKTRGKVVCSETITNISDKLLPVYYTQESIEQVTEEDWLKIVGNNS